MRRTRIKNIEHPLFKQVWKLYKSAFPPDERRQLRTQIKIMRNRFYHFDLITDRAKNLTGCILWWKFENLVYIEHLAILPRFRGKGYGRRILDKFISRVKTDILLEVEHPITETNRRRIEFYQRAGFFLNEHAYKQPPYKKGGNYVSLALMTYPNVITKAKMECFCEKYHPEIFSRP